MGRGVSNGGVRKKVRANRGGIEWWRRLVLPRRGRKDSMLTPRELKQPQSDRLVERTAAWLKSVLAPRATKARHLARAAWDAMRGVAEVNAPRGNALTSMGCFLSGRQTLFPEEALFLADRAALDLCVSGLPMSVQRAWAELLSHPNAPSLPVYLTMAHLRRAGFVARRFESEEVMALAEKDRINTTEGGTEDTGADNVVVATTAPADSDSSTGAPIAAISPSTSSPSSPAASQPASQAAVTATNGESLSSQALRPDLSVWRVGGFKRRSLADTHPMFYVKAYDIRDAVPSLQAVRAAALRAAEERSRLRLVMNDRSAVLLVDVAANATPLSDRFVRRLAKPDAVKRATALRQGDVSSVFDEEVLASLEQGGLL